MNRVFKALAEYFLKGVLVVAPLAGAIFLLYWLASTIDEALNLSDLIWNNPKTGEAMYIPGLGILTAVVMLLIAGIIVTNFITEPIKNWFNKWLNRLPLFNFLYFSIKDIAEAFVGDEKKFNEPVVVEINPHGYKKIGFITQRELSKLGYPDEVIVYFPMSYSIAGEVVVVPSKNVRPLGMNAKDAMKLIVSGGVSGLD